MATSNDTTGHGAAVPRLVGLTAVFVLLAWASNAAVLAFDRFGYDYSEPLGIRRLVGEIVSINPVDVVAAFFTEPFFGFVNISMLASLIAIAVVEMVWRNQRRVVTLAVTGLSLPVGLLSLAAMASSWSAGHDGEWLGEAWPILEAFGIWTVALCMYSVAHLWPSSSDRARSSSVVLRCPVVSR